ncbi:MAG: enoyl-CoA hydratase/isomerase family protein [Chloroflexi bacterium]|nr:enoyl-CoA hydratase/isomerase family protein [Chloroflexota bacterium]
MPYQTLLYEKKDRVSVITLNRPRASNAIDARMAVELRELCQKVGEDEGTAVLILSGASKAFCVRSELDAALRSAENLSPASLKEFLGQFSVAGAVARLGFPVIAALNGDALDEGLEMALACDIRIASADAHFGLTHLSRGLLSWDGGTQRLSRLIGRAKALEMLLTAEIIDSQEAYRVGLVNKVVPGEKVMRQAMETAQRIVALAPIGLKYAKEAINSGLDLSLEQGLRLEADLAILLQTTEDRAEGINAFLGKRSPRFKGR